jgi:5-methylcytosine-specific restriction endonuclease McrA
MLHKGLKKRIDKKMELKCEICGKTYQAKHILSKYCGDKCKKAKTEQEYAYKLNRKYLGVYEYVSGYTGIDHPMVIRCLRCGKEITRSAGVLRHPLGECSCIKEKELKEKQSHQEVESELLLQKKLKYRFLQRQFKEAKRNKQCEKRIITKKCLQCGNTFTSCSALTKYCSVQCARRRHQSQKDLKKRKYILQNGSVDTDITLDKLYKRDNGVCHICGIKCNKKDYRVDGNATFIVGSAYPTIDHVYPISKGGTHTWNNIKLAHHSCNTIKSANESYVTQNGQIKMSI